MSNFIERISGRSEENLKAIIADLEAKVASFEQALKSADSEKSELESKNQQLRNENLCLEDELTRVKATKDAAFKNFDDLNAKCREEKKSHEDEVSNLKSTIADLRNDLSAKDALISSLENANSALETKCAAMERSIELAKAPSGVAAPTLEDFIQHREQLYADYVTAQENRINEILASASADSDYPSIEISSDPSFNLNGCTFVCLEVLKKIRGGYDSSTSSYSGWVPRFVYNNGHYPHRVSFFDFLCRASIQLDNNVWLSQKSFFYPKCMKSVSSDDRLIATFYANASLSLEFGLGESDHF